MDDFIKFTIDENFSIIDAMERINKNGKQILFTTDSKKRIIGCLTDGDVRRAILKSVSIDSPVKLISNKQFVFVKKDSYSFAKREMVRHHVRIIPLLSKEMKLKKIFFYEDMSSDITDCSVLIFAGGIGKRMRPLTLLTPKPLLSIGSGSIIENILDKFLSEGFKNIFISLNYKSGLIKKHLLKKYKNILDDSSFIIEKKPLGTAGSIFHLNENGNRDIITHNADIITDIDFRMLLNVHRKSGNSATAVLTKHQLKMEYGLANIHKGQLISINEKPTVNFFAMSGINVFKRETITHYKTKRMDMNELIEELIKMKYNVGYSIHNGLWYDIGSFENYIKAKEIYGG